MERSTVQSDLAAPPSAQKIRVPQIAKATAPSHGPMRIFISRQRPCSTFPQNRLDRVGFLRRQRRLLSGNLRRKTLPAARAAREKLRHHLDLIKVSLGIKNT
jgi:hypothetical protein